MRRTSALLASLALAGCSRNPSILFDHAGPHAAWTGWLFWLFFIVSGVVWLLVLGLLAFALHRGRTRAAQGHGPLPANPATDRMLARSVGGGIAATILALTVFVGASYAIDRRLLDLDGQARRMVVITANQWWWEIRYPDANSGQDVVTANELHLPVGEPVKLVLRSNDVIHSFWLPNVAGKRDIIPGLENTLVIRVDKAGVWHGRCAEFCGYQHAFMGVTVIAEPAADFEAWRSAQLAPAAEPSAEDEKRGKQVFESSGCGVCHHIRSGETGGDNSSAPDLTHLKSRNTIGAGAAPNTPGHLGGWILDPHRIKPGVHMPINLLSAADLRVLLAYLESLK
jgi:cytochrome c oxidase subunit II